MWMTAQHSKRWVSMAHSAVRMSLALALPFVVAGVVASPESAWAQATTAADSTTDRTYPALLAPSKPLGLPNSRPRLTLSMPITSRLLGLDSGIGELDISAALGTSGLTNEATSEAENFSWSLEAWQMNTASLAHIQCQQHSLTIDTFLAKNCQFVDQPVPDNAVNLIQVQGEWTAAPNVSVGVGLFRTENKNDALSDQFGQPLDQIASLFGLPSATLATADGVVEGISTNVSFGIEVERVGEFLLGLQLARYRQRSSLMDLGDPRDWAAAGRFDNSMSNAAQLSLAWQRGSFRGDLLGRYNERPIQLGQLGNQVISAPTSGFDLEFSWQPGATSSLSIGVSNLLDQSSSQNNLETTTDEGVQDIYGRIPYVRYKQDL